MPSLRGPGRPAHILRSPTASLFVGDLGEVAAHVHRSAALVVPLDGPMHLRGETGDWRACFGAWVPPRYAHRLACGQRRVAVLYLDPLRYGAGGAGGSEGELRLARAQDRWAKRAAQHLADSLPRLLRTGELASSEAYLAEDLLPRIGRSPLAVGPLARDVRDVLRELPIQELDLERASSSLALSSSRFSHLFSQQFGVSWAAYRNWRRLLHVSTALCQAPRSLTELALDWGFSSHAHLSASLRAGFGLTPSQLRALRPRLHRAGAGAG